MFPPQLLVRVESRALNKVALEDTEYHRVWVFTKAGANQWIVTQDGRPIASISIGRLASSVFWYDRQEVASILRTVQPTHEHLVYKLDGRRKLRWTREGLNMELVDGSLVYITRAQIQHLACTRADPLRTHTRALEGYIKLFNTEYETETLVSGFVAMVLWSKPDLVAKVRSTLAFRSNKFNAWFWEGIACLTR